MTDTHTEALVERVARAIAGELGKQDFGEPFELKDDLKVAYLDQGEVDFGLVARAAIEALPARNDERALKLVEAVKTAIQHAYEEGVEDGIGWEAAPMGDPQPQWIDSVARVTSLQIARSLASQPSQEQS